MPAGTAPGKLLGWTCATPGPPFPAWRARSSSTRRRSASRPCRRGTRSRASSSAPSSARSGTRRRTTSRWTSCAAPRCARRRRCSARREDEIALVESTSHGLSIAARALGLGSRDNVVTDDLEFLQVAIPWFKLVGGGLARRGAGGPERRRRGHGRLDRGAGERAHARGRRQLGAVVERLPARPGGAVGALPATRGSTSSWTRCRSSARCRWTWTGRRWTCSSPAATSG